MNQISHHAFVGMRADDDANLPERIAPPVDISLRAAAAGSAAPLLEGGSEPLQATVRRDRAFVPVLIISASIHVAVAAAFGLYDRPRVGMEGGQEIPVEIVVETIDNSPGVDDVRVDLPTPDLPAEPVFPPEPVQVAEAPPAVELPLPEPPPPLVLPEPEPPPPEPEPPVKVAEAPPPVELAAPEPPPPVVLPEPEPPPPEPEPPVKVAEAPPPVELPLPEPPPPLVLSEPEPPLPQPDLQPPPQRMAEVQLPDVEVPPPEPPPPLFLPKPDEPPAPVQMVEAGPVVPPQTAEPPPAALPPPAKVEPPRPPEPDLAARREQERRKAAEEARRKQEQQARQEQARREAQAKREAQQKAAAAAAAAPRPAAASAGDIASFKSRVAGKLASSKRYPDAARARGATGVAVVSFRIDASGNPSGISLAKSSGHADLDAETLAMVRRAAPFPAPPQGAPTSFSVPINYNLR